MKQRRMMHLGAFVHETGQHVAAWRHPDAYADRFTQAVNDLVAHRAAAGKHASVEPVEEAPRRAS